MLCDFYELTMGNGYFQGRAVRTGSRYFDRVLPQRCRTRAATAIAAGLEQVIEYIQDLHFDQEDIAYLRGREHVRRGISGLSAPTLSFTGDIWAVPEGTPVFPEEPILTVRAPAIQAQLVETFMLLTINHQSLIATKSNRIVRAAEGRTGAGVRLPPGPGGRRRHLSAPAQPTSAAAPARPAPSPTSSTASPPAGTMAHAWVQMFPSEYERLQDLLRAVSQQRHPAGGHLQYAQVRRARRHPGLQRGSEAPGHHQMRHPTGLRRHGLSDPGGPEDAGRRRLDRVQDLRVQLPGRVSHPGPAAAGGRRSTPSAWASG